MKHPRPTRAQIAAVVLVLAAGATGCGTTDETAPAADPAATPAADPAVDDPQSSTGASDAELLAAADNALDELERGTVFAVARDADGWKVSAIDPEGTANLVELSADGSTVTSGPIPAEDDRRARALQTAFAQEISVDHAEALASAREAGVDGVVDVVSLDVTDGVTWSVTVESGTADERTAIVDAETGEVLRVDQD